MSSENGLRFWVKGPGGEGQRYLINQVACWPTYVIGRNGSRYRVFFQSGDPVCRWCGPNADEVADGLQLTVTGSTGSSATWPSAWSSARRRRTW